MSFSTPMDLIVFVVLTMVALGVASFISGVVILVRRLDGSDLRQFTLQTAKLAESGISKDVAGLVGNAANLMEAMEKLTRTNRGIGILLTSLGLVLIIGAGVLAYYAFTFQSGQGYG